MSMHERMMSGKLFTDYCEGLPEERLQAKKYMKEFNDLNPDEFEKKADTEDDLAEERSLR